MQKTMIDFSDVFPDAKPVNDTPTRLISSLLAVLGGIAAALMLLRTIEAMAVGWSPTETAKNCFYFPKEHIIPEKSSIAQSLMSAAFFGTDALYFDSGEENTGIENISDSNISEDRYGDIPNVMPSDDPEKETPEAPLGEGSVADDIDIYAFDRSRVTAGELALIPYDLTLGAKTGEVLLSNTTAYEIDASEYLSKDYPIHAELSDYSEDEPLVLIIHTHGTEAYSPQDAISVSPSEIQRSSDRAENVVAVGAVMAELLNGAGIPTLHVDTMHDLDSYQRSYDLAADTIQRYLTKYPSIKYVFDVHRDAVATSSGDLIKPITVINGEVCAQVMFVVGTNEKGADHPDWETNFTVAAQLQSRLTSVYPRFARPINIRGASFNEQFTEGSLLLEIGSAANSLTEAKNAAKYLTYSIIDMIKASEG